MSTHHKLYRLLFAGVIGIFLTLLASPALASGPGDISSCEDDEVLRHIKQCKLPRFRLTEACRDLNDRPEAPAAAVNLELNVVAPTKVFTQQIGGPDLIRGAYMTYYALASEQLRTHVQNLLTTTELNAVVMDVKGDRGYIAYPTTVITATQIGAAKAVIKDWDTWMQWMEDNNIYTIARIVVFKDEPLAAGHPEWAVIDGETDEIWRDKEGLGWMDPFREEVWDYNIALAVEAAQHGFDEIQYDYVRFPTDGKIKQAGFSNENNQQNRIAAITEFIIRTEAALEPYDVKFAIDTFGLTPWRKDDMGIGQQIDYLMPHLDVLSPMLYPSTFADGLPRLPEYAIAIAFPYEVVNKSVIKAIERAQVVNPDIEIRPWIQDFGDYAFDRRIYTPEEIRLQMQGAADGGASGWMLWDPRVKFTTEALVPLAVLSAAPSTPATQTDATAPSSNNQASDTLPGAATQSAAPLQPAPVTSPAVYTPNLNGRLMVLEYHRIGETEERWQRTSDNFRADLQRLWAEGYYPVNMRDVLEGKLSEVPAGKRPIVLTFDDGTEGQFRILPDDSVDPDSAVGILLAFHQQHPDEWPLRATFYVLPGSGVMFGQSEWVDQKLKMLVDWGMEVGSHTMTHPKLSQLSVEDAKKELALSKAALEERLPGYEVVSLCIPYGLYPEDDLLVVSGTYQGTPYLYSSAVEVTGGLTSPPNSSSFNPYHIPRVQAIQSELDIWLSRANKPGVYYVSDGK